MRQIVSWLSRALPASLLILVIGAFCLGFRQRGPDSPIFCIAPLRDFGTVPCGSELRHTFHVTNQSAEAVERIQVAPGCSSCSSAEITRSSLSAGESAQVKVVVDAGTDVASLYREFIIHWKRQGEHQHHKTVLAVRADVVK